jgi:DNA primase catalytic subunit
MNYLKEIMLKSIFIKKIKNSQNLKEKGNEKYKLHISFLKWKNKLKSDINNINKNNNDNTYKNINNIRKGYNLLKKGLRKRYQLVFYKSLK